MTNRSAQVLVFLSIISYQRSNLIHLLFMPNHFHKVNPTCFFWHIHIKTEYISPLNLPFILCGLFTSSKKKETTVHIYIHLTVWYGFRSFLQSASVCTGTGNTLLVVAAALRWTNKPIISTGKHSRHPQGFCSVHQSRAKNQVCPIRKNHLCSMTPGG